MGTQTLMTLKQFEDLPEEGEYIYELDEGELVKMSRPKRRDGRVVARLIAILSNFVQRQRLGEVLGDVGCVLAREPDTLRGPDVAFMRAERTGDEDEWVEGAPDIAVEVVSPNDKASDIARKTRQYLAAGGRAVWVVYKDQIHVFEPGGKARILGLDDPLEAPEILPGFTITLREILE